MQRTTSSDELARGTHAVTRRARLDHGIAALSFALVAALGCVGCKSRRGPDASQGANPTTPARGGNVGTVVGVVRLLPGAIVPRYTPEQSGRTRETPGVSPLCPPPRDTDTLPVRGSGTPAGLSGVAVYATGDSPESFGAALPTTTPVEHRLAIRDCQLEPRLVVAAVGDALVIANESRDAFFPHAGPTRYMESVMPGASRRVELDHIDATTVTCGFSLACGRADLIVMRYPVYTISTDAGRFELHDVPADQPVKIHAWHPLFLENTVEARVTRGGTTTVELVLTPLSRYARQGLPTPERPDAGVPSGGSPNDIPAPPAPEPSRRRAR